MTSASFSGQGDLPAVDLEGFREQMREAGVEEIVPQIVIAFRTDLPRRAREIEEAVERGELERVLTSAHSLRSAAGSVHAHRLHALLRELEQAAADGAQDRMAPLGASIRGEIARVSEELAQE